MDASTIAAWGGLAAGLIGALAAGYAAVGRARDERLARRDRVRQERQATAIAEYQAIVDRLQGQVERQQRQIEQQQAAIDELHGDYAETREQLVEQYGYLRDLHRLAQRQAAQIAHLGGTAEAVPEMPPPPRPRPQGAADPGYTARSTAQDTSLSGVLSKGKPGGPPP